MTRKVLISLWILTVTAALTLTAVTVDLLSHPNTNQAGAGTAVGPADSRFEENVEIQAGMQVYTVGEEIRVRISPDPFSDVIRILEPGSRVFIQAVQTAQGRPWYRIEAGRGRNGWIPGESVTINPPAGTP